MDKQEVIDNFFNLYIENRLGQRAWWCGESIQKSPFDAWIFQEIICERKPDIIIECGTADGGSALFMAMIMDRIGKGKILTIENEFHRGQPKHKRIKYFRGSSTDNKIFEKVKFQIKETDKVMVILDSDHHSEHVSKELEMYHSLITQDQYLIVEDTFWEPDDGTGGPAKAKDEFLRGHSEFVVDKEREKFMMTYNENGYLLKQ